mmetsp:Transcript_28242/g.44780  ORF Transcript_28242/g.44780 Transcript_28242/m.44780 type:complete len:119 (+) Transcript_28242:41-397(+)
MGCSKSLQREFETETELFTVTVAKTDAISLGASLVKDKREDVALVASIDHDGSLMAWNRDHPDKEIRLGYRIVAVNECNYDYGNMVTQLGCCHGEYNLTVRRYPYLFCASSRANGTYV